MSDYAMRRQALRGTIAFVGIWFAAALFRAVFDLLNPAQAAGQTPLILAAYIVVPVVSFLFAYRRSPAFRALVDGIDLRWLVLAQYVRTAGIVFVLYEAWGLLPAGFALPAGWGDFIVGMTAPLVALAIGLRLSGARSAFFLWSAAGIVDLVAAVSLGLLHSPTPLGILRGPVSIDPINWFPLSLVPNFGVPMLLILHIAALLRARELSTAVAPRIAAA